MFKYKIKRKEATLYVKSKISENVPWLKEKMTYDKDFPCLKEEEYNLLEDSKKRFIDNKFGELLDYSISEWVIEYDNREKIDDKIVNCELCGQKNIQLLSKINNKKNQNSMIVGSSCINNYTQMKDAYGKTLSQIRKESSSITNRKLKNEEMLEKMFPNILQNIDKFNKIMNEKEYIIRRDIERKFRELNDSVNSKYNKYLKLKKISDERILEIENIYKQILQFFKLFEHYKNECENDLFGLSKNVSKWCHYSRDYNLISRLTKDGKITKATISSIKEPSFLEKIILKFKGELNSNGLILKNKNIGKSFKVSLDNGYIFFDVDSSSFIEDYKDYLFDGNSINIDKDNLIRNAIISDKISLDNSLKSLVDFSISKSQYKYKFSDITFNEVSFYNKIDKRYYVLKLKEFINYFKECILKGNINNNVQEILNYITKNAEVYLYSDYNEHLKNYGISLKDI